MTDERNGISASIPKTYNPINIRPLEELIDEANLGDVKDAIDDILRKESPMPLENLYRKVENTYSLEMEHSSDDCPSSESTEPYIDKGELVRSVVDRIIDGPDFKLTEDLNGEMCVIWPSTKAGNYCQFRIFKGLENHPFKIHQLSVIELKNALKYNYFNDVDDDVTILTTFDLLGFKDFDKFRDLALDLLSEIKEEIPEPEDFVPETLKDTIGDVYKTYGFPQLFRPSEFNGGFNRKPIQLTVDYFFLRSKKIVDLVYDELRKVKGVEICSPMDDGYAPSCTYSTLYGCISFKVERGLHPIIIFRDVIDKVNEKYHLEIQFTNWKPFIDKEPVLKNVKYRTVDDLVA